MDAKTALWRGEVAVDLIAALSLTPQMADCYELLGGFHPEQQRWLLDQEELHHLYKYLRFLKREELHQVPGVGLWLRYFPQLGSSPLPEFSDLVDQLWDNVLKGAKVLRLAYSFRQTRDINTAQVAAEHRNQVQQRMAEENSPKALRSGKTVLTDCLPGNGSPARLIERVAGMEARLKQRLGLINLEPGLVLNYLYARQRNLEDLLDPHQFEELSALLFREEGWRVEVTQETRDGGKDVIATREENGQPVVVYLQAKRNRQSRAVSISEVKEFAATLAGDGVKQGVMLTTSHFSPDAVQWSRTKGAKLAVVDFIERKRLIAELARLSGKRPGIFLRP